MSIFSRKNLVRMLAGLALLCLAATPALAASSASGFPLHHPAPPAAPGGGVVGDGSPGSCTEAAVDSALAGGGTVTFNCGGTISILLLNPKTISVDTVLAGGDQVTLTAGLAAHLFTVNPGASLTLQHIILDSGYNVGADGGAVVNHGSLILEHTTIQFSQTDSDHSGGAIFSDGPLTIRDSTFKNNTAGSGGAIFANFGAALVTITGSHFNLNQAINTTTGYGGAIWMGSQSQLSFTDGSLSGNQARYGGAVYLSPDAQATLQGTQLGVMITDNTVTNDGGAVYNEGGMLSLLNANFTANQAPSTPNPAGYGGAVANFGKLALQDSYFGMNTARYGGALFVGGSTYPARADIDGTSFLQNSAAQSGGAFYANNETSVITITHSVFNGNSANIGGGVSRFNAHLTIQASSITQNTAAQGGGGLYTSAGPTVDIGGTVQVRDATISTNTSTDGHGGGIYNQGLLELGNVTIKDNTNGIFNSGSGETTTIYNSALDNVADLNCDGDGTLPQSLGGNFSNDNSCFFSSTGDHQGIGLDEKLGPLTVDTYGPTFYHMPQAGSPLINAAVAACSPLDQRGAHRPDACDSGAVEYKGLLPMAYLPFVQK